MENSYQETKYLMKKYQINANKGLGQNFLIDDEVIQDIANAAEIEKDDLVIEIGPGLGVLTKELLSQAGKVIAVELDGRMVSILKDRFSLYQNFEIIQEDVLKVDIQKLIKEEKEQTKIQKVKIVANLPYYITTPIIMKLLEEKLEIDSITVMIQKEVAERLVAKPGSKLAGAITYAVHYYTEPQSIRLVPNTSFIPAPEVESEVITLKIRKNSPVEVEDEKLFFQVIKASFMQRRKTLVNGLVNGNIVGNKEEAIQTLKKLELDERIRGENLTLEEFANISNLLMKN